MNKSVKYTVGLITLLAFLLVGTISFQGTVNASPATSVADGPGNLPGLGSDILLPGDGAIGPAAGNQERPQIEAGANGYLVVWEDSRANSLGILGNQGCSGGDPCGQTLKDIYAARLDANGQLIDTIPIVVSQATWDQTLPQVSWNG